MKVITKETNKSGLESLIGENVMLVCCRYIYTGKLIGLDNESCLLENCKTVYETGPWSNDEWKIAESLNVSEYYIAIQSIESFGITNKK